MAKKIDKEVLEHVRIMCYKAALAGMINAKTRNEVREIAKNYLESNGYLINWVKCDEENNTAITIDENKLIIWISEVDIPGSYKSLMYEIIL